MVAMSDVETRLLAGVVAAIQRWLDELGTKVAALQAGERGTMARLSELEAAHALALGRVADLEADRLSKDALDERVAALEAGRVLGAVKEAERGAVGERVVQGEPGEPDGYLATHPNGGAQIALVKEAFARLAPAWTIRPLYALTDGEWAVILADRRALDPEGLK